MVAVFGLLAVLPLVKLVGVQFADAAALAEQGREQRQRTVAIPALRGSILDRNGVEMALSVPRKTVAVSKVRLAAAGITDDAMLREFGARLASQLHLDPTVVGQKLVDADADARWTVIDRYADADLALAAVKASEVQDMAGTVMLDDSSERVHPGGGSGLRVLGTLGPDGPGPRAGVEAQYDEVLRGRTGKMVVERGNGGHTITDTKHVLTEPEPGQDLQLTLDRTLQFETEQILSKGAENAKAAGGIAIVGRPSTGELLAVAGVERDESTGGIRLADGPLALSNAYQAGSVFKLVTTAAAYEAGVIDDQSTFSVPDHIEVYDRTFSDSHDHPVQAMNVDQVVAESSNVGTIQIAQRVGRDRLHKALVDFGFGRVSALGNPAENAGLLPDAEAWTPPDTAAAAIGSFQSATVLQLWSAYNVIANQGIYVPPRLVEGTIDADGKLDAAPAAATRRVVSAATASRVGRALQAVIKEGTGRQWSLPGYPVAAKTGTGRMPSPEKVDGRDAYIWADGTYHYVTTFAGYLPADRPQVSITVMLFDTAQGLTGSTSAGPVFSDLARLSIRELSVAPTVVSPGPEPEATAPVRSAPAGAAVAATDKALVSTPSTPSGARSGARSGADASSRRGAGSSSGAGSTSSVTTSTTIATSRSTRARPDTG